MAVGSVTTILASRSIVTGTAYFLGWCHKSLSIFQFRTGQNHSRSMLQTALCREKNTAVKTICQVMGSIKSQKLPRKIVSAIILQRKMNRQYGRQNSFFWPGRKRTAWSSDGLPDSKMQSGVLMESMANPMGATYNPFICLKKSGSTQAMHHMTIVFAK